MGTPCRRAPATGSGLTTVRRRAVGDRRCRSTGPVTVVSPLPGGRHLDVAGRRADRPTATRRP
ncbi:hypothetical protein BRD01_04750 [Halobacteriales archaeon QS_8_65_32]|nr:MAG: hypothetical protein BRD01_04750 [Halobacteriales archaeon QS_8_65_32]